MARPLTNIQNEDACPVFKLYIGMTYEQRYYKPIPLEGCTGCYWCYPFQESNRILAANSEKKKIPDNRRADPSQEYAMTLTMPPDYKTEEEMIKAAECILNKASTNPPQPERADRWAYAVEYTKQGVPHVHMTYHVPSGRALSSKTIKYYWPIWNPEGPHRDKTRPPNGYNRPVRHSESYDDYIGKEGAVFRS